MSSEKSMIIGLGPEYNYPGTVAEWQKNNTRYASNHGASFISRALARQFDADYVDDFSDIPRLRNRYDCCIVALASHVSTKRDISFYVDVIEKLDIKTVAFSLGVQDYVPSSAHVPALHDSVIRFLRAVSSRSEWIGVRGHFTAGILMKSGFKNVVPIGCPTVFWNMRSILTIRKSPTFRRPLIAYHRTLAGANPRLLEGPVILGHDFLDEAVFTDNLKDDAALQNLERREYASYKNSARILELLRTRSIFPRDFNGWFRTIGKSDFVFGPRLHGCIAALVQGIPALLFTRDLRTREMAETFDIPFVRFNNLPDLNLAAAYDDADYNLFAETYRKRYYNYKEYLQIIGLEMTEEPQSG